MSFSDIEISNKLLDRTLSSLTDGVCIINAKKAGYPILYVNPAFETISGFSQQEVLDEDYLFLDNTGSKETELDVINSALKNGQCCHVVLRSKRKDGTLFWNETILSSIQDRDGTVAYFISVQKDISDDIHLQKTITDQITALESAKKRLESLAQTDSLTGLYNKRYLDLQYPTQFSIAKRNKDCITVFMVDVDHFKLYNDHYGHLQGDKCLKQIADALRLQFKRTSDFIARFGGEEFIIFSVGLNEQQAQVSAQNLLEYMKDLKIPHEKSDKGHVTLSIGIASALWEHVIGHRELVEQADKAMYLAKNAGRNKAVVY